MFQRTKLPDGPRVISARLPGTRSLAVAVYVLVGSRLESRDRAGVAHFMEHLTFKGTQAYPTTRAVSEAIEGVGGTSNAATDRESTVYWTRLPRREADRAFDVLGELVVRPLLRPEDIDRERDIIVEEIRSYRDDPGQYVYNVFDEAFFGDTPLGWEIAGDEESVRALTAEDIHDFWAAGYQPANLVVAVAGDMEHDEAVDLDASPLRHRRWRGARVSAGTRRAPGHAPDGQGELDRAGASLPRRARACDATIPTSGRWSCSTPFSGDGSSSRLFQQLREENGLAYDVHSFQTDYADCGTLQVYAGVDPHDLGQGSRGRDWPSSPAFATSRSRRRSWRRRAPTRAAASSCAWRRAGTWPRGWAGRRHSTTGC